MPRGRNRFGRIRRLVSDTQRVYNSRQTDVGLITMTAYGAQASWNIPNQKEKQMRHFSMLLRKYYYYDYYYYSLLRHTRQHTSTQTQTANN